MRIQVRHVLAPIMALVLIGTSVSLRADDLIRPFTTTTLARIRQDLAGKGFIVGLWSLSCTHCREDLRVLAALRRRQPELPLILIATDPIAEREEARAVLQEYGLHDLPTWMFADEFSEPLRHSIDPRWYGELPRSYFYATDHSVRAYSGTLSEDLLQRDLGQILREGPRQ